MKCFAGLWLLWKKVEYLNLKNGITINQFLFSNMENRLFGYLQKKSRVTGQNPVVASHSQIATELGTAREVVSRVMKKLEADGKVRQLKRSIEIL